MYFDYFNSLIKFILGPIMFKLVVSLLITVIILYILNVNLSEESRMKFRYTIQCFWGSAVLYDTIVLAFVENRAEHNVNLGYVNFGPIWLLSMLLLFSPDVFKEFVASATNISDTATNTQNTTENHIISIHQPESSS